MKTGLSILAALCALSFSLEAIACGDSMYRVGKGVSYRVYTAPLPGNVLVYGESEGARELAEALARSGHGVRLVNNQSELNSELSTGGYDVVIAPYADHGTVEASARASGEIKTTYLPVVGTSEEAKIASRDYSKVMVADQDEIKHYLKAIHKALKKKS